MDRRRRYAPEVRERAVRMVFDHEGEYSSQWSACSWRSGPPAAPGKPFAAGEGVAEQDQNYFSEPENISGA